MVVWLLTEHWKQRALESEGGPAVRAKLPGAHEGSGERFGPLARRVALDFGSVPETTSEVDPTYTEVVNPADLPAPPPPWPIAPPPSETRPPDH